MTNKKTQATSPFLKYQYQPVMGRYDELTSGSNLPKTHWHDFILSFNNLSEKQLNNLIERSLQLIANNEIPLNNYDDNNNNNDADKNKRWELDPIPCIISEKDWRFIEDGLKQRTLLLNLIIADIYGEQKLISDKIIPASIIYANPHFIRPLHKKNIKNNLFLHNYAVDIARSPDGGWWVLKDTTDTPSGSGYAIKNRSILSRIFADIYPVSQIKRLTPYFLKIRDNLTELAQTGKENPRIVLLTSGNQSESYFEHAYTARHLGLTLVESGDLTVRNNIVYLKNIDGLKPVDVILRKIKGNLCDPIELKSSSLIGIAGLVQSAVNKQISIANHIGSGIAEAPALMAFLPSICRYFLNEELKIPSIATWWCGQPKECDYVLSNLENLTIKNAFDDVLPIKKNNDIIAAIKQKPWNFVGMENIAMSTVPFWEDNKIIASPFYIRTYATSNGSSYEIMQGGLALSLNRFLSKEKSKDVWVLNEEKETKTSKTTIKTEPPKVLRVSFDLPSRVGDNMYWLGRHIERCEDMARLLRSVLVRCLEGADIWEENELETLVSVFAFLGHLPLEYDFKNIQNAVDNILEFNCSLTPSFGFGLSAKNLEHLSENVRDRLSSDTWHILKNLWHCFIKYDTNIKNIEPILVSFDNIILNLNAVAGLSMENMTRETSWRFMDLGRRVERSLHATDLILGLINCYQKNISPSLKAILEVADSRMTYLARYLSDPQFLLLFDLLLIDETNPRSLAFQINTINEHLKIINNNNALGLYTDEQKIIIDILAMIRTVNIASFISGKNEVFSKKLIDYTLMLREKINLLSETLTKNYFVKTTQTRQNPVLASDL